MRAPVRAAAWAVCVAATGMAALLSASCQPYGREPVREAAERTETGWAPTTAPAALNPVPRYGGTAVTEKLMPRDAQAAYRWTKHMGTLVAYEHYLRQYPQGMGADFCRAEIRRRFVPAERDWQDAWGLFSRMEIIDGVVFDPEEGVILLGRPGSGRLAPFLYDDLLVALKCSLSGEPVGVTMTRVFKARYQQPEDPRKPPYGAYETSVEFFANGLWNTHLAHVLFEGDRVLKSLAAGFDIFAGGPLRASVPGFATVLEMERQRPAREITEQVEYGRVWIELTTVRINTTEQRNVAMFSDLKLDVRSESEHEPPRRFAQHIREHYAEYAKEFPIFAEVERAARVVAIAKWLSENYPDVSTKLLAEAYDPVRVFVPHVIEGRYDQTHKTANGEFGLIGGVVFPWINRYEVTPGAKVGNTELGSLPAAVLRSRPDRHSLAWLVPLGAHEQGDFIAWNFAPAADVHGDRIGHMAPLAIAREE